MTTDSTGSTDHDSLTITVPADWWYGHIGAPLGAVSRALNEAIGRSVLHAHPTLRDLLIRTGNALDDVLFDLEGLTSNDR